MPKEACWFLQEAPVWFFMFHLCTGWYLLTAGSIIYRDPKSQEVNPSYSGEVDIAKAKAPKILNREELVKAIVDHKKNTQEMRQRGFGGIWRCFLLLHHLHLRRNIVPEIMALNGHAWLYLSRQKDSTGLQIYVVFCIKVETVFDSMIKMLEDTMLLRRRKYQYLKSRQLCEEDMLVIIGHLFCSEDIWRHVRTMWKSEGPILWSLNYTEFLFRAHPETHEYLRGQREAIAAAGSVGTRVSRHPLGAQWTSGDVRWLVDCHKGPSHEAKSMEDR